MDERYGRAYSDIFAQWSRLPERTAGTRALPLPWSFDLAQLIESVDETLPLGGKLRSDAKALLIVNLRELVVTPLALGGAGPDVYPQQAVTADVERLASRAEPSLGDQLGTSEVTAHGLLDSLSRNWQDLRLASAGIWGPDA
jgi:hypothetical protein